MTCVLNAYFSMSCVLAHIVLLLQVYSDVI